MFALPAASAAPVSRSLLLSFLPFALLLPPLSLPFLPFHFSAPPPRWHKCAALAHVRRRGPSKPPARLPADCISAVRKFARGPRPPALRAYVTTTTTSARQIGRTKLARRVARARLDSSVCPSVCLSVSLSLCLSVARSAGAQPEARVVAEAARVLKKTRCSRAGLRRAPGADFSAELRWA